MSDTTPAPTQPDPIDPVNTPDTGHGEPPKKPPTISKQDGIGGA